VDLDCAGTFCVRIEDTDRAVLVMVVATAAAAVAALTLAATTAAAGVFDAVVELLEWVVVVFGEVVELLFEVTASCLPFCCACCLTSTYSFA
jgi:phage-related protein